MLNSSPLSFSRQSKNVPAVKGKSVQSEVEIEASADEPRFPLPVSLLWKKKRILKKVPEVTTVHKVKRRKSVQPKTPSKMKENRPIHYPRSPAPRRPSNPSRLEQDPPEKKPIKISKILGKSLKRQKELKKELKRQNKVLQKLKEKEKFELKLQNGKIRKTNYAKFKQERFRPKSAWGAHKIPEEKQLIVEINAQRDKRRKERMRALSAGKARIGLDTYQHIKGIVNPKNRSYSFERQIDEKPKKPRRPEISEFIKHKKKLIKREKEQLLLQKQAEELKRLNFLKQLDDHSKHNLQKKSKKHSKKFKKTKKLSLLVDENKPNKIQLVYDSDENDKSFEDIAQNVLNLKLPNHESSDSSYVFHDIKSYSSEEPESFQQNIVKIQALIRGFLVRRRQSKTSVSRNTTRKRKQELQDILKDQLVWHDLQIQNLENLRNQDVKEIKETVHGQPSHIENALMEIIDRRYQQVGEFLEENIEEVERVLTKELTDQELLKLEHELEHKKSVFVKDEEPSFINVPKNPKETLQRLRDQLVLDIDSADISMNTSNLQIPMFKDEKKHPVVEVEEDQLIVTHDEISDFQNISRIEESATKIQSEDPSVNIGSFDTEENKSEKSELERQYPPTGTDKSLFDTYGSAIFEEPYKIDSSKENIGNLAKSYETDALEQRETAHISRDVEESLQFENLRTYDIGLLGVERKTEDNMRSFDEDEVFDTVSEDKDDLNKRKLIRKQEVYDLKPAEYQEIQLEKPEIAPNFIEEDIISSEDENEKQELPSKDLIDEKALLYSIERELKEEPTEKLISLEELNSLSEEFLHEIMLNISQYLPEKRQLPGLPALDITSLMNQAPFEPPISARSRIQTDLPRIQSYAEEIFTLAKGFEEEINAQLRTPLQIDPHTVLLELQEAEIGKLSIVNLKKRVPILNLKIFIEPVQDDKSGSESPDTLQLLTEAEHIHNKLIFDCIDESLQKFRPYKTIGRPMPWSYRNRNVNEPVTTLDSCKQEVMKTLEHWNSFQAGKIFTNVSDSERKFLNERMLRSIREELLASLVADDIAEKDEEWVDYFLEESQINLDLADMMFEKLVEELISILC